MNAFATAVVVVVAVGLVIGATLVFRARNPGPWPAMGLSALTCAVSFTVGGATGQHDDGPDIATVMGGVVGILTVLAAILALVPKERSRVRPERFPVWLATVGVVLGVIGLLLSLLSD